jgi:hypothetical protein
LPSPEGGFTHWNLNDLLRHLTVDLAGDKAAWLLGSMTELDKRRRPIRSSDAQPPWLAVDLPAKDENDRIAVKAGPVLTGIF